MIHDIWTVVWKEWQEVREQLLSLRRGGLSALILALILGVVAPVQLGAEWVESRLIIGYWPFLAATMVSSLIADSVAGERERHTLETLLASRLSDLAILIGKIVAGVLLVWGLMLFTMGLGTLSAYLRSNGERLPISAGGVGAVLVIYLLVCCVVSCAAVLVSLRASTVR